ncbi:MAG: pseudouridine synthase [Chlamydiia bacterium]|jgi:23S rRNA pseudouridine2605 synthase|nr:pseudouridine synthase [Chlamydiota bacterium]
METKKRLSKALASAGVASRRHSEELIFAGKVSVNGEIIKVPQTLVCWETDMILVDGQKIKGEEKKFYFMLNKPKNYICSNARVGTKKIILDLFKGIPERLFTVGRLDRDTTGLILVTNDGHFANQVIHPSANLSKEYIVKTSQEITHEHLIAISKGAYIEETWITPVRVSKVRKGTLKVVVKEGKKREVRILVENAGLTILELSRVRIGGLLLSEIPEGQYKEMTETEKKIIFS